MQEPDNDNQGSEARAALSSRGQVAPVSSLQTGLSATPVNPAVQTDSSQASASLDGATGSAAIGREASGRSDAKFAEPGQPRSLEVVTSGMILPDGAMVEQLSGARMLLAVDGMENIGPTMEHGGIRYLPVPLDPKLARALQLPEATEEFESIPVLIRNISAALHRHSGLDQAAGLLVASFVVATWVVEFLPVPPVLNLWGLAGAESAVWAILTCLCRRPVAMADFSLTSVVRLPDALSPTIFLRHPSATALHRFVNFTSMGQQGVLYGEQFVQVSSPVVSFTSRPVSVAALRLPLSVYETPYRRVSQVELDELRPLQRRLLKYRLTCHQQVAGSRFDAPSFGQETRVIARTLGACVEGCKTIQHQIVEALAEHDESAKAASAQAPEAVVLEALLTLVHEGCAAATIREIRELTDGIFLGRQDSTHLSDQNVGTMLREVFGLATNRRSRGVELRLDSVAAEAIHAAARSRGVLSLLVPRAGCAVCIGSTCAAVPCSTDSADAPSASSAPHTSSTPTEHPEDDETEFGSAMSSEGNNHAE